MERIRPLVTLRTSLSFVVLILSQMSAEAAICSAPLQVDFAENNAIGAVVAEITVEPGVTLAFNKPPENNPFSLEGNLLKAARVLDYETEKRYVVNIMCSQPSSGSTLPLPIVVIVLNLNDNPPFFEGDPYSVSVSEMAPVGTTVGRFPADDLDNHPQLFYTLTSASNDFALKSETAPEVLVNARLDYEKVKSVQLVLRVQDTSLAPADGRASHTATATITVTITDGDNRPPWFQPCNKVEMGGAVICQSAGYTGIVTLNEQEPGVLPLKPGPLYAIDGDYAIGEAISYSFLSGNEAGLFDINPNTGNITMRKPADVLGRVTLTVLAAQRINSHQFATTTVTISVVVKSLHPPRFQKPQYEGIISSVGSMAMDATDKGKPLQIIATDDDYLATEGINPFIAYSITGSSDFNLLDGYLFMMNNLADTTLTLQVTATDTSNDESVTSQLTVEVKSGLTTTTTAATSKSPSPSPTEISPSSSSPSMSTDSSISPSSPSATSGSTIPTINPSASTEGRFPTTNPTLTPEGTSSTSSTGRPAVSGGYGVEEMAALGASLGILLFACLVIIGVLVHRMQRGKADSKKIYEASIFRSSLGQDGQKEGIQYTNEAFQNDDDGGSVGSGGPDRGNLTASSKSPWDTPKNEAILRSTAPLHALLPDDMSDAGSDKTDDKGVKPILTKERRVEEGYKSVWFKEDIDPNAKEEVVIIPDSRADDSEDDDSDNDPSSMPQTKSSKVLFADTDLDSGLGVKIEDPGEDSDGDEMENIDL